MKLTQSTDSNLSQNASQLVSSCRYSNLPPSFNLPGEVVANGRSRLCESFAKCYGIDQVIAVGVGHIGRSLACFQWSLAEARPFARDQSMNVPVGVELLVPSVQHRDRGRIVVLLCFESLARDFSKPT